MINNIGCKPTFVIKNRSEVLDITLSSTELYPFITDWKVTDHILTSDHKCITYDLNLDTPPPILFRNPAATNWPIFMHQLKTKLNINLTESDLTNTDELDKEVNSLQNIIIEFYEAACPLHKHKSGQSIPYYTSEIRNLRTKMRKAFNKARSPRSTGTWEEFYALQRKYKSELSKKEKISWREQCSYVDNLRDQSKMFKILSKDPIQLVGSLQLPSGQYTNTLEEVYEHLASVHFPGCKIHNTTDTIPEPTTGPATSNVALIRTIVTNEKIKWAVNSFAPYKSPGEDRIFPALMQKSIPLITHRLRRIYIAALTLKYTPKNWRSVRVAFTPKPGNNDYSKANNFRPISLTSFFLKALEKLIDRYIRDVPLEKKKLQKNQHAYQPGKSCENALHNITTTIEESLQANEYALGCFIDITGAFNYITFAAIINACTKFGIDPGITDWIYHMLKSRIVYIRYGHSLLTVTVTRGSPQGGVLPPLLWCLVIDEILEILNKMKHKTEGFSDDLAVVVRGKFVPTLCDILQSILNKVTNWCTKNELEINPNKTKMILFRKNRKSVEGLYIPKIKGKTILLVNEVKYLGIILDYLLSWIPNIDNRIQRATIALWQCRKAYGKSWGLSPKVLHWIYTSIIRPIILYGAFLWNHKCTQKAIIDKLNAFQRLACKAITGAWHSAPTAALEVILDLTPLHILIEAETLSVMSRLARNPDTRIKNTSHTNIWFRSKSFLPIIHNKTDYIAPVYKFERNFSLNIPDRAIWRDEILPSPHTTNFYTDGSLINESAGAGVFCDTINIQLSISLGTSTSIYLAELAAIIKSCQSISSKQLTGHDISIFTDSQSAIKALNCPKICSALTLKCYEELQNATTTNRINLTWVPGHTGIVGNEKADELAKQGALTTPTNTLPDPLIGIPQAIIKQNIEGYKRQRFNKHWLDQNGCRQAKNNITMRKKHSKYLINISRIRLKIYTGVMTGHFDFNKHLTNIGKKQDPGCDLCGEHIDSADHYLCQCPAYISSRYKFLGNFTF